MRLFRRRPPRPAITEAQAYARLHGERGEDLLSVAPLPPAPPPIPRASAFGRITGETLRRAFEERLAARSVREG